MDGRTVSQLDKASQSGADQEFVKGLGLVSATTLVMGSMIGSGVFIVAADMARIVDSPALLIAAWLVAGFMTVVAALSYGELAAMMPKAGGQYVYLREALGPLWGFLYGWTLFLVIQCGTIAAVGVAFGKFLGVFFPSISSTHWILHLWKVPPIPLGPMVLGNMDVGLNTQNLVAIAIIVLLSMVNIFGVKTGAIVQVVFTTAKVAGLLGLILLRRLGRKHLGSAARQLRRELLAPCGPGCAAQNSGWSQRRDRPCRHHHGHCRGAGRVVVLGRCLEQRHLHRRRGPQSATQPAALARRRHRRCHPDLHRGELHLSAGASAVGRSDLGMTVLGRGIQYASEDRVATAVMQQIMGQGGAKLMALAILVSTFGCNNGLILAGSRVYYAMARDGLFFRSVGRLHPRYKTPHLSLMVQAVWASVLCLSGSYGQLLDYTIFAVLLFYILTLAGLFVLRRTRPDAPRPYRALGYPWLPAIYIVMALFIDIVLLLYKPQYTWPGLVIVLLGIPVYFIWHHGKKSDVLEER